MTENENVTPIRTDVTPELQAGAYTFTATCPECNGLVRFPIELFPRLTVDQSGGKLRVQMSSKTQEHSCSSADGEPLF
jgi:hypothetical protein